ncbi:MAG: MFS transporter, partial [Monoglobales bacterium]
MNHSLQKTSTFFSNGLIYGLNGIITILPLYLSQFFDSVEMGYLLAIPPLLMCIAPLFWGNVTDRVKNQNSIMIVLAIGAAVMYLSLRISSNFYFTAAMLIGFSFFQSSFGSLIDVLTIRSAEKFRMNYGFFRIMGALIYGLMAWFVTLFAKTETSFVIFVISAVLASIFVAMMPKIKKVSHEEKTDVKDSSSALKNKELWFLIIVIALPFFAWGYYQNFFPNYITDELGLDKSIWGMMAFLNAFSELPFFFYFNRIYNNFRLKQIIMISCSVIVVRYLVYAIVKNAVILVIT